MPLFYFEASSDQLLMPTKDTLGGSNKECRTFKGLWGEISANPISSKMTITIAFCPSESFCCYFWNSKDFKALSKIFSMPCEVDWTEP